MSAVSKKKRCGARTRAGGLCSHWAVEGRERCRYHGGMTPRGAASPHFKHGRKMRHLPRRYAEVFAAAIEDPELVSLRPQIALLDARENELLGQLSTMESGQAWREAMAAFEALAHAVQQGSQDRVRASLADLQRALRQGRREYAVWGEMRETMEGRRRLVETERRRIEAAGAYITPDEAVSFAGAFVQIIREEIQDAAIMRRIVGRIQDAFLPTQGLIEARRLRAEAERGEEEDGRAEKPANAEAHLEE